LCLITFLQESLELTLVVVSDHQQDVPLHQHQHQVSLQHRRPYQPLDRVRG
jgi:hypothetical protein